LCHEGSPERRTAHRQGVSIKLDTVGALILQGVGQDAEADAVEGRIGQAHLSRRFQALSEQARQTCSRAGQCRDAIEEAADEVADLKQEVLATCDTVRLRRPLVEDLL
jgi:hypothetical protein